MEWHALERAFFLHERRFNKTITAKDFAHEDPQLPTIVKFHGDLSDERSLVVTESDYFRRIAFGVAPIVGRDEQDESDALRVFLEELHAAVARQAR